MESTEAMQTPIAMRPQEPHRTLNSATRGMPDFSPIVASVTPQSCRIEHEAGTPSFIMATPGSVPATPGSYPMEGSHQATPHKVLHHSDHHYKTPTTRLQMLQALRNSGSPVFKTPSSGRSTQSCKMTPHTPSSTALSTPSFRRGRVSNPFDCVDYLSQPVVSPSMFATQSVLSDQSPGPFHWNIEHIAELNPADIDEMPFHQMHRPDEEKEHQAQQAIDRFFSQHPIVPSPWTEERTRPVLPRTPASCEEMFSPMCGAEKKPASVTKSNKVDAHESYMEMDSVSVQTALTLPVDFDIQKVLGEYMTGKSDDKSSSPQDLSSSSLRRKLFFHGDEGTPLSPVRTEKGKKQDMDYQVSPPVSPVRCRTPLGDHSHLTPNSDHFSSSPITGGCVSSGLRRCSTAPDLACSPPVSPISGMKEGESTPVLNQQRVQATPSSGAASVPLGSPGMSPIHTPMEPADSSYLNNSGQSYSRTTGARRKICRKTLQKSGVSTELFPASPVKSLNRTALDPGASDTSIMEVEDSVCGPEDKRASVSLPAYLQPNPHDYTNLSSTSPTKSSFPLSSSEISQCQDTISHTQGFSSQDTGYQSNSLQSTNHDTGLHTNLTNQFGCLPWGSQDSMCQDSLSANQSGKPVIFKEVFHPPDDLDCKPSEDHILQRAKDVLARLGDSSSAPYVSNEDVSADSGMVPLYPWQPVLATPQRQTFQNLGVVSEKTGLRIKPSEVAERVLAKANEDYVKYFGDDDMCETPTSQPYMSSVF